MSTAALRAAATAVAATPFKRRCQLQNQEFRCKDSARRYLDPKLKVIPVETRRLFWTLPWKKEAM